jgi:choline dehydrogenase-like flavoprotein
MTVDENGPSTRVVIEGGWAPAFQDAFAQTRRTLRNKFARLGAIILPGSFQRLPPGGESHYAGTLSMGDLLTRECEVIGAPGLYVVDGSAFGRLPAKHFTFGIMANADRVGRHMAAQHQRATGATTGV